MPEQTLLFYEDIMDAIIKMVNGNPKGLSIKQIAMDLWPSRNPDTARAAFSRALNEENNDVNLNPPELVKTMHITSRPEDIIYFLCDEFGFERPARKDKSTFEREVKGQVRDIQERIGAVLQELKRMETGK